MRKLIAIAVAILLGAASINAAEVETISLRYMPNQTIATIHVNGQVRVTHQTEIPKDGKGHRVIVDLLSATHNLGSNKFDNLPDCTIKSIRSSQFAVSPEQITRVVFDVDRAPIYRIETDQQSVTIYFTDKDVKQFASWNSKMAASHPSPPAKPPVVASKSANHKPAATVAAAPNSNEKPVTKTEPAPSKPTVVASKSPVQNQPSATKPADKPKSTSVATDHAGDRFAMAKQMSEAKTASTPEVNTPTPKATQSKPEASQPPAPTQKAEPKNSTEHRPVVVVADNKSKAPETTLVTETPKRMPLKSEMKPANESASNASGKTGEKPEGQTALANKIAKNSPTPTKTVAKATPSPKVSTSRFRRNPGQSGVKGTMVVEFPKRLVIKYKGGKYRDPFETLINADKSTNNPIEKQVPNIDGLRLVGVIESDAKSDRALFEDADGFGYILKSGDKVRNGYVLRVESDKVYFQIFEYGWSRTVALQLED